MNWFRMEGASLEQLLVAPNALRAKAAPCDWRSLVKQSADAENCTDVDIAKYLNWARARPAASIDVNLFAWQHTANSAERLLSYSGRSCRVRENQRDPGIERLIWRWASLAVPTLSLRAAEARGASIPDGVEVLDPVMAPSKFAVLHVHYGQMLSFESIWYGMVKRFNFTGALSVRGELLVRDGSPPAGFRVPGASDREAAISWETALLSAFVARRALQAWGYREPERRSLIDAATGFGDGYFLQQDAFYWGRCRAATKTVISEAELQGHLFELLRREKSKWTEIWSRVFDQYLRVRAILYAHIVHRPREQGLSAFVKRASNADAYEKISLAQRDLRLEVTRIDASRCAAIEVRASASTWLRNKPHRYYPTIKSASGLGGRQQMLGEIQSAWIVSFDRSNSKDGIRSTRRQYSSQFPAHYHAWRKIRMELKSVRKLIGQYPAALRSTRGLDVMGLEKEGPLWIVLQSVKELRKYSQAVAAMSRLEGVDPFRLTVHVGEDYDHQLTGLRRISEPLLWGALERGDRLGHAVPLGLDSEKWAERRPQIQTTWWDRLIDLGWAFDCLHEFELKYQDNLYWMCEEARRCIEHIWQDSTDLHGERALDKARDLWKLLGRPNLLLEMEYPTPGAPPARGTAYRMLFDYLYSTSIRSRAMEQTCIVDTKRDLPITVATQQYLRRILGRLQIFIEIQPSSNLFVGGVDGLLDQYFFQMRVPTDEDGKDVLRLAISSDDPLAFATTTQDEYGYAWAGMVVAGRSPALATEWLEDVARNSMRAKFCHDKSIEWAEKACKT